MSKNNQPTVVAQPVYIPLAQAYPVFAGVQQVKPPSEWGTGPSAISPELWGILENTHQFTIRQHVKLLPKACCMCPPCVKQPNSYSVYAGMNTKDAQAEILRVDEVSDDWNRCCCNPTHPWRLEVRQYIPVPGDSAVSDYHHLTQDMQRDWRGWQAQRRQQELYNLYAQQPALLSIVRNDGQRCCAKLPCKLLNTWVCCSCCQDGVSVYAGQLHDPEGKEKGRPIEGIDSSRLIGRVVQPILGGGCLPTLNIFEGNSEVHNESNAFGKIEGPCCFGGWSEFCFDFKFFASKKNSPSKTGDIGIITKKKPQSMALAVQELFTESDVYTIEFNANDRISASQKTMVLAGQLLADYMFFEGTAEKCEDTGSAIYCNFFFWSCWGNLIPCRCIIPKGGQ